MLRKLCLVISFLSIGFILVGNTGCWNLGLSTTVDSSGNTGYFTSMKISKVHSWTVPSSIDTTGSLTSIPGLAIDSTGLLYQVYELGTTIYVATKPQNGTWSTQAVANGSFPDWLNMTADNNGHAYVVYNDLGTHDLHYVTNLSGSYTNQSLNTTHSEYFTSIALDQSGNPHIVYYSVDSSKLMHATTVASIWTTEPVGAGFNAYFSAVAIGKDNRIQVAFIDEATTFKVYYSVKSSSTWSTETIDSFPGAYGIFPKISIDVSASGNPHIAYYAYDSTLRYATKSGSTWTIQTVDNTTAELPGIYGCAISLDHNGNPHIVYGSLLGLAYATKSGSSWTHEYVKQNEGVFFDYPALAINSTGEPEIAVDDLTLLNYDYITKSKNVIHLSYYDASHEQLMHATGLYGIWGTEVIDTTAINASSGIAIDTSGYPHVVYGSSADTSVRYASRTSGTWTMEKLDNGYYNIGLGSAVSMDIGNNNIPQLAYFYLPDSTIRYAVKTTSTWVKQDVDHAPAPYAGIDNSIAVDQNNFPYIAYCDYSGGAYYQPKFAALTSSNWLIESLDSMGIYNGSNISVAIDNKGNPFITYGYYTSQIYASWNNGSWNLKTIDSATDKVWIYTDAQALAFDNNNNPHVLYLDIVSTALYHAERIDKASQKWYIDNPTDAGNGGYFGSLGLQNGYVPSVAYYYGTGTSLQFIQRTPTFYSLPDIKVLVGQTIDSAYNLLDYASYTSSSWNYTPASYQFLANPLVVNLSIDSPTPIVSYGLTTDTGFAADTVWYEDSGNTFANTYWSQFKQSNFLLKKFPKVIAEGTTFEENGSFNMSNYLSQSTTYSGVTHFGITVSGVNSADTGSISPVLLPNGNIILGSLSAPLSDQVDLTVRASSDIGGTDWDKEIIRVYPVLNTHSEFSTASETTQWAFELPANISTAAKVGWIPGLGGTGGVFGNLQIQFTAANQGIKITPLRSNWVPTQPNQWYTVRILMQADTTTAVNNNIVASLFAFNGELPSPTDIGAYVTVGVTTAWTWYEIPIFSSGTSMYCQIQIKNTSTATGKIKINRYEVIKSRPETELMYGTPHVSGSEETWNNALDTSKWAFELMNGVTASPSYTITTGLLDLSYAGDQARGAKITAALPTGGVRTYPMVVGKTGGMSLRFRESGTLSNPLILVAVYGTDSANSSTIKELGAYANVFHVVSNDHEIIRLAYPGTRPYGYMQMQFKNSGAAHFYILNVNQETDNDRDYYWDNGLFP